MPAVEQERPQPTVAEQVEAWFAKQPDIISCAVFERISLADCKRYQRNWRHTETHRGAGKKERQIFASLRFSQCVESGCPHYKKIETPNLTARGRLTGQLLRKPDKPISKAITSVNAMELAVIRKFYTAGASDATIERWMGLSDKMVRRWRKYYGLPVAHEALHHGNHLWEKTHKEIIVAILQQIERELPAQEDMI